MPFINTKLSCQLSKEKEGSLKTAYGKIISMYPGKSEQWLMLNFEDNCRMYFGGTNELPCAVVEVKVLGDKVDVPASEKMTAAICQTLEEELSIPKDRIYINYFANVHWGWNGANF